MVTEPYPTVHPLDCLALRGIPSDPALIVGDRTLCFEELNVRVGRLAAWLRQAVPNEGARVATWLPKGEMACLMPLAAVRADLVHVPVNPQLKRRQVAHILSDSGAQLLIANKGRLATLEGDEASGAIKMEENEVWREAEAYSPLCSQGNRRPDDLAAILYTSGSTGKPKGVMLSQANLWLGAASVSAYLGLTSSDRTLAVLPLAFDYGQNQLLSAWHAAGTVVALDYMAPRDVIKAVVENEITTLAAVPPLWIQLLEQDWPAEALVHLTRLTNSGGALTTTLVRRLREAFPAADLYAMYGLTEAFRSTFLAPTLIERHPTSIGTAIPFAEIMVVTDDGRDAEPNEEGELVHAGPLVAKGYWQDPARTAERFKQAPSFSALGGIAVWSGDRVRRDRKGLLHFLGRRDAMIKTSGCRVSPQEIEEAAIATGLVAEAVAIGVPDPRLGEAIHLIARPSGDPLRATTELVQALTRVLPNFMVPRSVHWREELPRNPNGKLDRAALVAELVPAAGP